MTEKALPSHLEQNAAPEEEIIKIVRSLKGYLAATKQVKGSVCNLSFKKTAEESTADDVKNADETPSVKLEAVKGQLTDCRRCPLCELRKTIVFGEGNPQAQLLFVGEGPGEEEDRQGRPFVGRAGQLLDKIIAAMGLKRDDVYIANIVKCRPPGNRAPKPQEVEACTPFLNEQIRAINPRVLCALGSVAAKFLLGTEATISVLRGRFHTYGKVDLMATYHPAYLLRNPEAKKPVWEDMRLIMERLKQETGL